MVFEYSVTLNRQNPALQLLVAKLDNTNEFITLESYIQSLPKVLRTPTTLCIISHKNYFYLYHTIQIPFPPINNVEFKCLSVREMSASIATVSVPVNTVYNNIVLRGRGGQY